MAYQLPQNEVTSSARNERLGNVAIKVESFDFSNNTVHGYNVRDGEQMSIRMVTKDEFADLFVNRDRYTTEEARRQQALAQTKRQPTARGMANNVEGDTVVLQMQSVVRKPDGELVARWMNALNSRPEIDAYKPAHINVHIPKSNEDTKGAYERRFATAIFTDETEAASMDALDRMTANKLTGLEGNALEGQIRSAVLVAVSDGNNTNSALLRTGNDPDGSFSSGGDKLLEQPMNRFSWKAQTALAAMVDKPFDELRWGTGSGEQLSAAQAQAKDLYEAVQNGHVAVAITPAVMSDLMPHVRDKVVNLEQKSAETGGSVARMSGREFYAADVSFRSSGGNNEYAPSTNIKEVLPSEFMKSEKAPDFVALRLGDLGAQSVVNAGGHAALVKQAAVQQQAEAQASQQAEKAKASGFAASAPGM